ncbi:hypothetical protein PINS_up022388 [Pythium insidiosum]|nr:hypothetical protein PINS_up022388 [Pythium insidiosum]
MVLKTFVALSASAATVAVVQAALLETNPTTLVPDVVPLGRRHPAYGADVPDEVVEFEVKRPDNATAVDAHDGRRRSLEETSRDIQRLEEHFKASMETRLSEFEKPEFRQAAFERAPWPSSYWPIYQDGINARWDPQDQSPAEKYARAFGHDPKAFMDKVSAVNGVDSMSRRRQCKETTDCASLRDGSICGKREGQSTGRCIPGWFGICHAWAPAAILEREPRCAVQKGNVTFQPFDLKALLTEVYDGVQLPTVFTGARFNGPDEPVKLDKYGRYEDAARRDLGPGFFHIAIANIMGRFKQSFIVDVTAGSEVWNQPVRGYDIQEIRKLSPSAAAQTYFGTSKYVFNTAAVNVAYVKNQFSWIVEGIENGPMVETGRVDVYTRSATYEYLLELDKDDKVIGGEWVGDSRYNHPDFLWFAINKPGADAVTSTNIKYREVQELLEQSIKCEPLTPVPTTPTPTTPSPTTPEPTTPAPTTPSPTTAEPTTPVPTTSAPVTPEPTTVAPATPAPTTEAPTTPAPTTSIPATPLPTTSAPVTPEPTTAAPTPEPTTNVPVTPVPTTSAPVSQSRRHRFQRLQNRQRRAQRPQSQRRLPRRPQSQHQRLRRLLRRQRSLRALRCQHLLPSQRRPLLRLLSQRRRRLPLLHRRQWILRPRSAARCDLESTFTGPTCASRTADRLTSAASFAERQSDARRTRTSARASRATQSATSSTASVACAGATASSLGRSRPVAVCPRPVHRRTPVRLLPRASAATPSRELAAALRAATVNHGTTGTTSASPCHRSAPRCSRTWTFTAPTSLSSAVCAPTSAVRGAAERVGAPRSRSSLALATARPVATSRGARDSLATRPAPCLASSCRPASSSSNCCTLWLGAFLKSVRA